MIDDEARLTLYLDGKLDLSVDDLRQIRLSLDEDIGCRPESKYWAAREKRMQAWNALHRDAPKELKDKRRAEYNEAAALVAKLEAEKEAKKAYWKARREAAQAK